MLGEAIALPVNGRNPFVVQEALKRGNIKLVPFEKADPFGSVPGFPAYLSTTVRNWSGTTAYQRRFGNPKYAHHPPGFPYYGAPYAYIISTSKSQPNQPRNSAPPPMFPQPPPPPPPPKNNSPPRARMETKEEKNRREAREKAEAEEDARYFRNLYAREAQRRAEEARRKAAWNKRLNEAHRATQASNKNRFNKLNLANLNTKMRNINNGMARIEKQYGESDALLKRHAWFFTKRRFEPITKEVERLRKVHANAKWALKQLKELKTSSSNTAYRHGIRHLDTFEKSHANIKWRSSNVMGYFRMYFRELPALVARWEAKEKNISNAKDRNEARKRHAQVANAYLSKLNKEHENKLKAATKIQAAYKGVLARRNLAQMKKARENAATKIQAAVRGAKNRRILAAKQTAATRIQSVFRGGLARKRFVNIKRLGVNEAKAKANANAATRAANKAKEAAKEAEGKLRSGWQYLKWSNPEAYHDYVAHVRPFEVALNQSRNRMFKTQGWVRNALPGLGVVNQKLKDNYEAAFQKWYRQFFKKNTNQKAANLVATTHKNATAAKEKANAAEAERRRAVQAAVEAARAARQARVASRNVRQLQFVRAR